MTSSPPGTPKTPAKRPTFADIRACQPAPGSEGLLGRLERTGSLPITWLLVQTPISANQVTVLWMLLGVLGGALLAAGQYIWSILGALIFILVLLLDDVDGEVARYRKTPSLLGVYLDLAGHNIVKSLLFTGMALGVYQAHPQLWVILLGISAALGMVVGDNFRFYRDYLLALKNVSLPAGPSGGAAQKIMNRLEILWDSQGIYALTLLGALTGTLLWVLVFYGVLNPLWMLRTLARISRRFAALSSQG